MRKNRRVNNIHAIGDISGLSGNQINGLHQQVVVEVLVEVEEKIHAYFPQSKGKNQSGNIQNEVFEAFGFLFNLHAVERREVRSNPIISEVCF